MILIDLQKAFNTIDDEILLQKPKAIRFSKGALQWFKCYISEAIFHVSIESKLSDFGKTSCGVPQGSILGPLSFLIYVNHMPQAFESTLLLYAGDSCILYQHKKVDEIEKQLNKDFVDNKLSIQNKHGKQKAISYSGPSIWNSLSDSIKRANSLNTFKHNVKKHCLT